MSIMTTTAVQLGAAPISNNDNWVHGDMTTHAIKSFGPDSKLWALSDEEVSRQAIASLRGYIYQLHASLATWIRLSEGGELHLEVAEDYAELLANPDSEEQRLHAVQVKETRESGSVTLNSTDVLKAISTLFALQEANPGREVSMTFLTTSPIGQEAKLPLPCGVPALKHWADVAEDSDAAEMLEALKARFQEGGLADFLQNCSHQELRERLLKRMSFACSAIQSDQLEAEGRDYLVSIRDVVQADVVNARKAYDAILGAVIKRVVNPSTRSLNRQMFLDTFLAATATSLPSQVVVDLTSIAARAATFVETEVIQKENSPAALLKLAERLRDYASPPSLLPLFPEASESAKDSLEALSQNERWVVEDKATNGHGPATRMRISRLSQQAGRHHLIYAVPGAGKSHALHQMTDVLIRHWKTHNAKKLGLKPTLLGLISRAIGLAGPPMLPIILPIGGLKSAAAVQLLLERQLEDIDFATMLKDPDICILLDGWSEFAVDEPIEKSALLLALHEVKVIATARHADDSDAAFKCWSLERLSNNQIHEVHADAFGSSQKPIEQILDLIKLPLILSLYLLLGGTKATVGELLSAFHQHLSKGVPERFDDALTDAVSFLSMRNDRSFSGLQAALHTSAANLGLTESRAALSTLGTISQRGGISVPIHDLYWSWLSGVGILRSGKLSQALPILQTRESLRLAIESGEHIRSNWVDEYAGIDASLCSFFDAHLNAPSISPKLGKQLKEMLQHQQSAIRSRGAIAALKTGRTYYFKKALQFLDEAAEGKHYIHQLVDALEPKLLFAHQAEISAWLGGPGTFHVLNVIASRGTAQWLPWLEQMYRSGLLTPIQALSTALACGTSIPSWGLEHLPSLAFKEAHQLRFSYERGANKPLANWIAEHYSDATDMDFSSTWHRNRVLISCGDDEVYEMLRQRFSHFPPQAQEHLALAVPEFGDKWVTKFQKVGFSDPQQEHLHGLLAVTSMDTDDDTARAWIGRGYVAQGWAVLIARHGNAMLPELIGELPKSFAGHLTIPALKAIATMDELPESFLQLLEERLLAGSSPEFPLMPSVIESSIVAATKVKPQGMGWLIRMSQHMPEMFSGYYGMRFLEHYEKWRKATGIKAMAGDANKNMPFDEWFISTQFVMKDEDTFLPQILRDRPEIAIKLVTWPFSKDDERSKMLLSNLRPLTFYDPKLFERMINSSSLAPMMLQVFGDAFSHFPPQQLLLLVKSPFLQNTSLFYPLRNADATTFTESHVVLIDRLLSEPLKLEYVRYVANMMKNYDVEELVEIFEPLLNSDGTPGDDRLHWLLREIGEAKKQLIIDEDGRFLI